MSSALLVLCLLSSSIGFSEAFARQTKPVGSDAGMYETILASAAGPADGLIGTVGEVYGAFPAFVFLQTILAANGKTVDSIVSPALGTVIKPKKSGATGAPAATTVPSV